MAIEGIFTFDAVYLPIDDIICPLAIETPNEEPNDNGGGGEEPPTATVCETERTISYALFASIPQQIEPSTEIFKECCYTHYVFGELEGNNKLKNDYTAINYQKQLPNDSVDFVLKDIKNDNEYVLDNSTLGTYFGFNSFSENKDFKGFKLEWQKVLQNIGEGQYVLIKRINTLGQTIDQESHVYTLKSYSDAYADKTVRIDTIMNGYLNKSCIDYTGLNWENSIRLPGFFGRREVQYEEDILINRNYEKKQISMQQSNEYKFQTNQIPNCIVSEIFDYILFANSIFFNDYNLNNTTYNYKNFLVKYASNEGTAYSSLNRKASINLTFNDHFVNNRKNNYY